MKFRKYSTSKKGDDGAKLSVAEGARSSDREKESEAEFALGIAGQLFSLSLSLCVECWNNTMNIRIIHK